MKLHNYFKFASSHKEKGYSILHYCLYSHIPEYIWIYPGISTLYTFTHMCMSMCTCIYSSIPIYTDVYLRLTALCFCIVLTLVITDSSLLGGGLLAKQPPLKTRGMTSASLTATILLMGIAKVSCRSRKYASALNLLSHTEKGYSI